MCGIQSPEVKARLVRDADLTLRKAIDICRTSEISKAQLRNLGTIQESTVNTIKSSKQRRTFSKQNAREEVAQQGKNERKKCSRCGYNEHEMRNFPAFIQTCNKSQERNHFAKVRRSVRKPIHAVEEDSDSQDDCSDSQEMFIYSVHKSKKDVSINEWHVKVKMGKKNVALKLERNVMLCLANYIIK